MATWRVNNSTSLGGEVCSPWQANHAYSLGARCVCTVAYATTAARAVVFECTTAGTSHATTQPTWDYTVGNTTADGAGTLIWTARSPSDGSWDNATCILHYILNSASLSANDVIYIDDGHNESVDLGNFSYKVKGNSSDVASSIRIYSVDKTDDSINAGAIVESGETSTSYPMLFEGSGYSYGVTYKSKTHIKLGGSWELATDAGSIIISIANSLGIYNTSGVCDVHIYGDIEFQGSADRFYVGSDNPSGFKWHRGNLIAASGVTRFIYQNAGAKGYLEMSNIDLSQIGNNYLIDVNTSYTFIGKFTRCKLPETNSGIVNWLNDIGNGSYVDMIHCSYGSKVYAFIRSCSQGSVTDETTIVRTGGSSDGTTSYSQKMASSALCKEWSGNGYLVSLPITSWTSSTTEKTFTVEFIHDSATALQDDEIWMEFEYPADNSSGLGAIVTNRCLPLGTPADTTDSSKTWTTTGLTNPNTRKLSVTVTPGKAGPICARVYLAKASTTVYVDPMITES